MVVVMDVWDCNAVDSVCCHGGVLNKNLERNVVVQMAV